MDGDFSSNRGLLENVHALHGGGSGLAQSREQVLDRLFKQEPRPILNFFF